MQTKSSGFALVTTGMQLCRLAVSGFHGIRWHSFSEYVASDMSFARCGTKVRRGRSGRLDD